jgi:AcrR family transcriptional regulator
MPRSFSPLERANIRKALIDTAAGAISRDGLGKLSIDPLVKAVHISKGAFYLFYSSKEMLILDVVQHVQECARADLWTAITADMSDQNDDVARRLLEGLFSVFVNYPIFAELSKPDSLVQLIRGLPQDVLDDEFKSDEEFFRSLFEELVQRRQVRDMDLGVLCGLPRMVLALELNKDMIGLDRYCELKEMFVSGMATQLTVPASDARNHSESVRAGCNN